jgi:hypothetical protein
LWVVVIGIGVLVIPGLTLYSAGSTDINTNIKDGGSEEINNKTKVPNKNKVKIIDAICDFNPHKLNMKSKGKFITVYIEIVDVDSYNVNDIILEEIVLNGFLNIEAKPFNIGDQNDNDIPDLMVKFDRSAVINYLLDVEPLQFWEVEITGGLFDGAEFKATSLLELLNF